MYDSLMLVFTMEAWIVMPRTWNQSTCSGHACFISILLKHKQEICILLTSDLAFCFQAVISAKISNWKHLHPAIILGLDSFPLMSSKCCHFWLDFLNGKFLLWKWWFVIGQVDGSTSFQLFISYLPCYHL